MPQDTPRLPFEIDDAIDPTLVTGRAGVPLVIELFRHLGVAAAIDAQVLVKQRQRGLQPSQLVESLIALWVSGGAPRSRWIVRRPSGSRFRPPTSRSCRRSCGSQPTHGSRACARSSPDRLATASSWVARRA